MKEDGNIYLEGETSAHCLHAKQEGVTCILNRHLLPADHARALTIAGA